MQCAHHITVSNTLLFAVSSKILSPHLFLIYTCSTFPCQHAIVLSCFTRLIIPLLVFCEMICQPLFVFLSVFFSHFVLLRITTSDYPFGIFILFLMYNITELMYYVTELNILWFNQSINHLNPSNKDLCNSYWYIIFSVYCKVISTMVTRQWL
jgi:hypothetical protein